MTYWVFFIRKERYDIERLEKLRPTEEIEMLNQLKQIMSDTNQGSNTTKDKTKEDKRLTW